MESSGSSRVRIEQLPVSVSGLIRSSVQIVSPARCVEELLYNAIDAEADCIAVRLDLEKRWRIVVVDNGVGIHPLDMNNVGKRYFTSKCHSTEELSRSSVYHGYRGESLCSIAQVSGLMEIKSKCPNSRETSCQLFWHGKPWKCSSTDYTELAGTTVTVMDFFYNLPVRRKAMKISVEINAIRQSLSMIAVVYPNISMSLKDENTGSTLFSAIKCDSTQDSFRRIFGESAALGLRKLKHRRGNIVLEGFVKEQLYDRSVKLLFVNKVFLKKCKLQSVVDAACAKALQCARSEKGFVYILNFRVPYGEYELVHEHKCRAIEFADWPALISCVEESFAKFKDERILRVDDAEEEEDIGRLISQDVPESLPRCDNWSDANRRMNVNEKLASFAQDERPSGTSLKIRRKVSEPCRSNRSGIVAAPYFMIVKHAPKLPRLKTLDFPSLYKCLSDEVPSDFESVNFVAGKKLCRKRSASHITVRGSSVPSVSKTQDFFSDFDSEASKTPKSWYLHEDNRVVFDVPGNSETIEMESAGNPVPVSDEANRCDQLTKSALNIGLGVRGENRSDPSSGVNFPDPNKRESDSKVESISSSISPESVLSWSSHRFREESSPEKRVWKDTSDVAIVKSKSRSIFSDLDELDGSAEIRKISVETSRCSKPGSIIEKWRTSQTKPDDSQCTSHPLSACSEAFVEYPQKNFPAETIDLVSDEVRSELTPVLNLEEANFVSLTESCTRNDFLDSLSVQASQSSKKGSFLDKWRNGSLASSQAYRSLGSPEDSPNVGPQSNDLLDAGSSDSSLFREVNDVDQGSHACAREELNSCEWTGLERNESHEIDDVGGGKSCSLASDEVGLERMNPDHIDDLLKRKLQPSTIAGVTVRQEPWADEKSTSFTHFEYDWDNPVFPVIPQVTDFCVLTEGATLKFTKNMLETFRVVGQADKKFIIVIGEDDQSASWLIAIDQHAIHERIRLETFLTENIEIVNGNKVLRSCPVDPPIKVELPKRDAEIFYSLSELSSAYGLRCSNWEESDSSVLIYFSRIPSCFMERSIVEIIKGGQKRNNGPFLSGIGIPLRSGDPEELRNLCAKFLLELIERVNSMDGARVWSLPRTVLDILASRACKVVPNSKVVKGHMQKEELEFNSDFYFFKTALHWAGKRNNLEVVRLLLANGADPNIRNADGKIPGQLSTQPAVRSLLGVSDPVEDGVGEPLDIIPNYLAHPQLNYRVDIGARNPIINFRNGLGTPAASSSPIVDELVLKVRIAGMDDDFIEIDVPKSDLTYENLLSTACAELEIPDQTRVKRIRKLPNTIVRRDKDVTRLGPFQEIELIMTDHR
ncbi:unnamed protein product [Notodromas monacha]|uniref:Histidine kinase/HSP90-like ATPase domain-containing protein n=1 Tax=Notodromas monacha TaxID=399045 RepID=A0A7R9BCT6_9CRUS|nr:unnamed protein product [Notodromas monacha]CAG0912975.1 unnamed protein product [Notodromas monacha]